MRTGKKPSARLWAGQPWQQACSMRQKAVGAAVDRAARRQEGTRGKHRAPRQTAMPRHRGGHVRRGSGIQRFGGWPFRGRYRYGVSSFFERLGKKIIFLNEGIRGTTSPQNGTLLSGNRL